jgi:hypothetical protein
MNKVQNTITKVIKVILWVVVIVVLISVIIAGLVQIPSVQNKIVDAATSFVSKRTQTKVEVKNISIKFPKTVVIEGLFLEDTEKDTLIYAGLVKINIALYGLFSREIATSSVSLEDAVIRLYSTKTDPLFNYNFLITFIRRFNPTNTIRYFKSFKMDFQPRQCISQKHQVYIQRCICRNKCFRGNPTIGIQRGRICP